MPSRLAACSAASCPASWRTRSRPSISAIEASASVRCRSGGPSTKPAAHAIQASTSCGTRVRYGSRPVAARPLASKNSEKIGVDVVSGEHRPGRSGQLEVVGRRGGEGVGQGDLQLRTHRADDLGDQLVLGREVVDDRAIADPQPLGHTTEGDLAQAVVERCRQRPGQQLVLGVLVPHRRPERTEPPAEDRVDGPRPARRASRPGGLSPVRAR